MKPSIFYSDIFKPEVMQPTNIMKITNIEGLSPVKTPVEILNDIDNFIYDCMDLIQHQGFTEYVTEKYKIIQGLRWEVIDKILNFN